MKIVVSACLLGENCKYNGGNNRNEALIRMLSGHSVIPVRRDGVSVDDAFRRGAERALEIAKKEQPDLIILQSRSPSCGVKQIYDGTFSGTLIPGQGIFAKMASEAGFRVADAEDLPDGAVTGAGFPQE